MSEETATPVPSETGRQAVVPAAAADLPPHPPPGEPPPGPDPVAERPPPPAPEPEPQPEPVAQQPEPEPEAEPAPAVEEPPPDNKHWYVVKVQSGREESIKESIERRVKIERLEEQFGQIVIPTEKVGEMRNNKRVTRQRKLYPGYLLGEVEDNDDILYLFCVTSGVRD